MSQFRYVDLRPLSREEIMVAILSASSEIVADALVRMALFEPDENWAQELCIEALRDRRAVVRSAALTAIGHLARRFHALDLGTVLPAIRELLRDPDSRGVAEDALDDIEMFVARSGNPDS